MEQMIAETPEDDWDAQWSVIQGCACCGAPAKAEKCSRCV